MYGESREFNFIETFGDYGLLRSGTSYLLYSVCSSCMCIHYLFHGSSIVKLALSLSSHSPILMNMMFKRKLGVIDVPFVSVDTMPTYEGVSKDQSCIVLSSTPPTPIVVLSEESEAYVCSEDNPDFHEIHGLELEELDLDDSEPEEDISPPKKVRPNYDLTRKFQMVWAVQCPWVEMKLTTKGLLHMV